MPSPAYHIYPLGETAAAIDFGNTIDEELNRRVLALDRWLRQHAFEGLRDLVVAYSSLTILYDPFVVNNRYKPGSTVFSFVKLKLEEAEAEAGVWTDSERSEVTIPVCYDPEFGSDIKLVAAAKQLSVEELVQLHCSKTYRVYMTGFLPGFPYMGKLDQGLVMPRKSQPRPVARGSVGIAGWQTGIYPLASPGGWQIIGRTPLSLFDPRKEKPALLTAGDMVRFEPITKAAFEEISSMTN